MVQNTIQNVYTTSDLALVTTLSLFYPIESVERTSSDKAMFLFRRAEGLDELIEAFWRRELNVEPQAYFTQLKIIKSRLYEGNRQC